MLTAVKFSALREEVMIVMLIACIRLLSFDGNDDRQRLRQDSSGSGDIHPEPPPLHRRAA